jgi:DNA-binding beta-propeller fold protein YncE
MKKLIYIFLFIILVLEFAGQIQAQKVKTVNGVKVITNGNKPKPPIGVPVKLSLEEEMTAGEGDDPEKSFAELGVFVVDDNGTIYAVDSKDKRVKVFDKEGKFLRNIGKPGQGPGELDFPGGILINPENQLVIEDATSRRLVFFSLEGEFIKNLSLADRLGLVNIYVDGKGNYLGREMGLSEDQSKMFFEIKKFGSDLKPLFTIDKIDFPIPLPGTKINIMDLIAVYQIDTKGNIFYGRNLDYEIKIFNPEGKHIRTIKKDYSKTKITEEDKEEMLSRIPNIGGPVNIKELFEFPKYFSPYQGFILDEQNRLYVRSWMKGKKAGDFVVDIFDEEGTFISQITNNIEWRLWKNGKLYGVEETDMGLKVIKRYKATWGLKVIKRYKATWN